MFLHQNRSSRQPAHSDRQLLCIKNEPMPDKYNMIFQISTNNTEDHIYDKFERLFYIISLKTHTKISMKTHSNTLDTFTKQCENDHSCSRAVRAHRNLHDNTVLQKDKQTSNRMVLSCHFSLLNLSVIRFALKKTHKPTKIMWTKS